MDINTREWPAMMPGPLPDTGVAIWLVVLAEVPPLDCLSQDERIRAAAAIDPLVGERYRAARRALRLILAAALGQNPADLLFSYGPARQPHLAWPEASGIAFSLSYREGVALVALSRAGPVGVDLETIDPSIPAFDIAASEFASAEVRELASASEEALAHNFTQMWVRKEALAKMSGKGLWEGLSSLPADHGAHAHWHDLSDLPQGFAGACASEAAPALITKARCVFTRPPGG